MKNTLEVVNHLSSAELSLNGNPAGCIIFKEGRYRYDNLSADSRSELVAKIAQRLDVLPSDIDSH